MIYDPALITKAYVDVTEHGFSVYKAARIHGIPESTLRDRTLGLQPVPSESSPLSKPGPAPIFSLSEEREFIDHVQYMAEIGYGYSRSECIRLATDYAVSVGKRSASASVLSADWFNGLKKRWPEIHLAKPQKLAMVRAKAASQEVLQRYYTDLEKVLRENNLMQRPDLIWNVDETGLLFEHSPSNVVCCKGAAPQAVTSSRGKTVTILAAGNAVGNRLPPFYVFAGKRWTDNLLENTTPGSAGTITESGWSNSNVFIEFLEKHLQKFAHVGKETMLILCDGHRSHVNLTLKNWGDNHKVKFFVLPPHTSHITQPLDVACFGPLKKAFYAECQSFLRQHLGLQVTRYNIAPSHQNLISSFRKTSIHPLIRP